MRVKQLLCGAGGVTFLLLVAQACGDSAQQKAAQASGAGDSGAAGAPSSPAGGSEGTPAGGNAAGEGVTTGAAAGAAGSGGTSGLGGEAPVGGAAACPEGPPGKAPTDYLAQFASGTRLEARYYASDGMPNAFAGFYDTQLGEWCDFMLASDDKLRCLPRSFALPGGQGFSDAGCTTNLFTLPHACASGKVYVRRRLECLDKAEVLTTKPYAGPLYSGSPASCTTTDAAPTDTATYDVAQPPTRFVEGKLVDLPGICAASLRLVEGSDAARGPYQAFDIASGAGCNTNGAACKPQRLAFEEPSLFSDAACKTAATQSYATWTNAASCGPPDFVQGSSAPGLYYRPGPAVNAATLYSSLGKCEKASSKAWIGSVYEMQDTAVQLAALTGKLLGSGRLQLPTATEAGKPLIATLGLDTYFYDTQLKANCFVRQLQDGTSRCIPSDIISAAGSSDEYGDKNCTVPVRRCQGANCPGTILYDDTADTKNCSSARTVTALWRVKAQATAYYRMDSQLPCYKGGNVGSDMWTVEPVDPQELAAPTLETAPAP